MHLHAYRLPGAQTNDRMVQMERQPTGVTDGREPGRLSPCVCSTLRMVSRAVTQLYDDILRPSGVRVTQFSILASIARGGEANLRQLEAALAIDQTTLTRSLNLLERDRMIERVLHPDGRIKAMRLTGKGRRVLSGSRPTRPGGRDGKRRFTLKTFRSWARSGPRSWRRARAENSKGVFAAATACFAGFSLASSPSATTRARSPDGMEPAQISTPSSR